MYTNYQDLRISFVPNLWEERSNKLFWLLSLYSQYTHELVFLVHQRKSNGEYQKIENDFQKKLEVYSTSEFWNIPSVQWAIREYFQTLWISKAGYKLWYHAVAYEGIYLYIQKDNHQYVLTVNFSVYWNYYYTSLYDDYHPDLLAFIWFIDKLISWFDFQKINPHSELWHAHVPAFGLESGAIPSAGIYPDITMELSSNCIKLENGLIVSDTFPYQPIYINESGRRINKACTVKDVLFQDTF